MAEPYRPYKRVLTRQEVCNLCRTSDLARKPEGFLISQYRPPFSDVFSAWTKNSNCQHVHRQLQRNQAIRDRL